MKKFTVYEIIAEDGKDVYKMTVPAESKKAAADYIARGGLTATVTRPHPFLSDINLECLADTLRRNAWGQAEIDTITRALDQIGLARN